MTRRRPDFVELAYEFPTELRPPDSEDYFKLPLLVAKEMGLFPAVYSMQTRTTPREEEEFEGLLVRRFRNPIELYLAASRAAPRLAHGHSFGWIPSTLGPTFLERYVFTAHVYRLDSYNRTLVYLAAKSIARSTAIIALTNWERNMLSAYADGAKIHVIPCGIDVRYFSTPDQEGTTRIRNEFSDSKLVLSVSNIVRRKNLTTLIRAFKLVKERLPRTKLLIAGTTPSHVLGIWRSTTHSDAWLQVLSDEVVSLGLQEDVIFLGYQGSDQLRALYQAADVFASASFVEGQFLSAGEAAAAGLPLALSDLEPLREIYAECARFHKPSDVQSVANSILEILLDETLAKRLGAAGRESIGKYDVPLTRAKLKALYEKCIT